MKDSRITTAWIAGILAAGVAINAIAFVTKARGDVPKPHPWAWLADGSLPIPPEFRKNVTKQVSLLSVALRDIGKRAHQLGVRRTLWCAAWLNRVLAKSGLRGTRSDLARSFLKLPRAAPKPGAIAVLWRRSPRSSSGHVGIVKGFDRRGNPIIVSGNHGRRVAVARYPKARVLAYVEPR